YVQGHGPLRAHFARAARTLLMLQSARASQRERDCSAAFVLRVVGNIDQLILRNLVAWHACVAPKLGKQPIDLTFLLGNACGETRLFDMISTSFVLAQIRNVAVLWDEEKLAFAARHSLEPARVDLRSFSPARAELH